MYHIDTPAAIDAVLERVNVLHSLHDISGLLIAYIQVFWDLREYCQNLNINSAKTGCGS